jgi:DNA-binding transcriptional regulator YdaS (Cro superfamily)
MTKKISKRPHRRLDQLDPGLQLAIKAAGGTITALADKLGIRPQAVAQWDMIPHGRILEVERVTGIDRRRLRPDMFIRSRVS